MFFKYLIWSIFIFSKINLFKCLLTPLVPSEAYSYQLTIDPTRPQLLNLYWKLINSDEIQFELHCQTTGYASLGISPDGNMPNSDIVIGWVDPSGPYLYVILINIFY